MTDPSGETSFYYDSRGRMYKKISTINGHDFTTEYTLTDGGRISSIEYPGGRTVTYDRNEACACEIEGVSTTFNGNNISLLSGISYRPFGGAKGMTTMEGEGSDQVANQFDLAGRLQVANPNQPQAQTYTYDDNGNLKSMATSGASIYNRAFDYDNLNRLTGATGPYGTISYQYDDVGNRTQRIMNSLTEAYSYDQGTNLLGQITSDAGTITYTYDSNGNTISISDTAKSESWVLTWTYDNRLMGVAKDGQVAAQYVYNGFGQRVKKIVNGETTLYHYDFDGNLIAESDDEGYTYTKAEYIYRGQSLVAKVDYEDYSPTTISRYLNDRLGTPQIMTNDSNQVIWEALYEPFGDAAVNYQSTVENNIRFPGQYLDSETGFHYNYHRYYNPRTGRYLSPDPIGQAGGINLFAYAKNNPTRFIDLMGLDVFATCWYTSGGSYLGFGYLECAVEETECVRKKRAKGRYFGIFSGLTIGSPVGITSFNLNFETLGDVRQLRGIGSIATTSSALGLGASWGQICLGEGCAYGWSAQKGLDLSVDLFGGFGWISDINEECCVY